MTFPLGLVCTPYHRGGVTRWMVDLAVEWARAHGPVTFVTVEPARPFRSAGGRPTMAALVREAGAPGVTLVAPRVGATFEFGMEAHRAATLARAIASAVPTGVPLLVSDDAAAWRAAAAVGDRHPLIGVLHSDEAHYYALAQRFAPQVAALVSVSHRIDAKARRDGDAGHALREVIACGTPQRPAVPRRGRPDANRVRLFWAGRIDEHQKRVSDLPAIVARAVALGVDCTLRIAGAGGDDELLRAAIARSGVAERIEMLGWQSADALAALHAESDLVLVPSNFEGMPVAVMEALAAGCGVIASRVSGVEDYVDHPDAHACYWTHDIGDVQRAAELVRSAAHVPDATRVAHAQSMARDCFSIERCAARYRRVAERMPWPATPRVETPALLARALSVPLAASRLARLWTGDALRRPDASVARPAMAGRS